MIELKVTERWFFFFLRNTCLFYFDAHRSKNCGTTLVIIIIIRSWGGDNFIRSPITTLGFTTVRPLHVNNFRTGHLRLMFSLDEIDDNRWRAQDFGIARGRGAKLKNIYKKNTRRLTSICYFIHYRKYQYGLKAFTRRKYFKRIE